MTKRTNNIDPILPNVAAWQPRKAKNDIISKPFYSRCEHVEATLLAGVASERRMNMDNYDSGLGVEDLIREELGNILPTRYSVRSGVLSDRTGQTAGDCDVLIFNDFWFPAVKAGATSASRRWHLPVEGTYAVLEVKQSLSIKTLDEAMRKLVTCSRLHRPPTSSFRVVENRDIADPGCEHDVINPLYTAIIATDLDSGTELDDMALRFIEINQLLARNEVVNCICVLGKGFLTWAFRDHDGLRPARFREIDSSLPLMPARIADAGRSYLYELVVSLSTHLFSSTLAAEDVAAHYGFNRSVQIAENSALHLQPSP
jgi:hypothetical protein